MPRSDLHLRSHDRVHWGDRHGFAQLVLPVRGDVLPDIEERQGRLDPLHGAVFEHGPWQLLMERPCTPLGTPARKLVEFVGIMAAQAAPPTSLIQGWVPLLLDTITLDAPRAATRLAALLSRIAAEPGLPWTTDAMARAANLSVSRLQALFHEGLDSSPHAWLQFGSLVTAVAVLYSVVGNALWNHAGRALPLTMMGQMIVFETIFAALYGFLWEGRWPNGFESAALALLAAGVVSCASAHRRK